MKITIESPFAPPGVNNLYTNVKGRGRVKSQRYVTWCNAAGWAFVGKGKIEGPFALDLTIGLKGLRKGRDLDGFAKAPLDLLVAHGIVSDDSLCRELYLSYEDGLEGFRCEVRPHFVPL